MIMITKEIFEKAIESENFLDTLTELVLENFFKELEREFLLQQEKDNFNE